MLFCLGTSGAEGNLENELASLLLNSGKKFKKVLLSLSMPRAKSKISFCSLVFSKDVSLYDILSFPDVCYKSVQLSNPGYLFMNMAILLSS